MDQWFRDRYLPLYEQGKPLCSWPLPTAEEAIVKLFGDSFKDKSVKEHTGKRRKFDLTPSASEQLKLDEIKRKQIMLMNSVDRIRWIPREGDEQDFRMLVALEPRDCFCNDKYIDGALRFAARLVASDFLWPHEEHDYFLRWRAIARNFYIECTSSCLRPVRQLPSRYLAGVEKNLRGQFIKAIRSKSKQKWREVTRCAYRMGVYATQGLKGYRIREFLHKELEGLANMQQKDAVEKSLRHGYADACITPPKIKDSLEKELVACQGKAWLYYWINQWVTTERPDVVTLDIILKKSEFDKASLTERELSYICGRALKEVGYKRSRTWKISDGKRGSIFWER